MKLDLDKRDLVTLCYGLVPPYGGCDHSQFCGNQWNEDWEWKQDVFENMIEEELFEFYLTRRPKGALAWTNLFL
jgi:hypothetical protein